jgi:hypothetical protein
MQGNDFYAAVLNAGTILWGFCGTFLAFRLQREAAYFRQPVADYNAKSGRNVLIGEQHFRLPFIVLGIATISSAVFGFALPLLGLSGAISPYIKPNIIVRGLLASLGLILLYFILELFHYEIIGRKKLTKDLKNKQESDRQIAEASKATSL